VRRQAKRDAALILQDATERAKAPSPLRSVGALQIPGQGAERAR
jgi:hypothetical protein